MIASGLVLAAFAALAVAVALDTVPGRAVPRPATYLVAAAASALLGGAGFLAVLGHGGTISLGTFLGFGSTALRADPLAGLFLALTGVVGTPVCLGFADWSRRADDVPYRGLGVGVAVTLAGVAVVVLADNVFALLFGWESVSLAFFLLSGYRRDIPGQSRRSTLTYAFSKTSGALLLVAFGLLAAQSGSFSLSRWAGTSGAPHVAAYALLLAGFAIKVGVVPFQVWVPVGYGCAPGPARALMSAVAANIGFYGMWRTLALLGRPPGWLVALVLVLGAVTALLGIAHASVNADIQRVVAYSSVENGGLITAGFGVALAGSAAGLPGLTAVGLLAATLQMVAHSFAKSGLFLSTAVIEQHLGTRDLDRLRGVGRELPVAGMAFSVGAFTLAGLPLTVGFVSEWFLLESVMQLFRLHDRFLQITLAASGALMALAIGFAGFSFVRLVGLTILGHLEERHPKQRAATSPLQILSLTIPTVCCVAVAALSPWEVRFLGRGLAPVVPRHATLGALSAPWVLQPVFPGFSVLSPSWLAIELPALAVLVVLAATALSRGTLWRVRRVPAWRSANGGTGADARYTPSGFANPTRRVLANVLLTRTALTAPTPPVEGVVQVYEIDEAIYRTDVVDVVDHVIYRPFLPPLRGAVKLATRLQSGRLDAYVAYMLIALIGLIAAVVGLS